MTVRPEDLDAEDREVVNADTQDAGAEDAADDDPNLRLAPDIGRRTLRLLRPWRGRLVAVSACILVQAALMTAGPALISYGIDEGVSKGDVDTVTLASLLFVAAAAGAYVFARAAIYGVSVVGEAFLLDLRTRVFRHIMGLSMGFFDRTRTGVLVSRMTADVEALQDLISQGLAVFVVSGVLVIGTLIAMFLLSWQLGLVVLLMSPILIVATVWYRRMSSRAYLRVRDRVGGTLTALQEGLAGVRVIQAFDQTERTVGDFIDTSREQYRTSVGAERITAIYNGIIQLVQGLTLALIIGLGAYFASDDAVTVGVVTAFVLYLNNLYEPIQQLTQVFNTFQQAAAALHKLYGLLDTPFDLLEPDDPAKLPATGQLVVDRVGFRYAPELPPVLRDVSLVLEPGRRLVLVGPTGAGKSTLAKLMARFYDPTEGTVSFGGVDLRDVDEATLRKAIVVIPQEGFLFNGTIRDNLRLAAPGATEDRIRAALDHLGLVERFERFPDGLDSRVETRGTNFSAGERQLVSVARAALVDPSVLVLDEATSSLDPGTELLLDRALERLMEGRTVVVIAHRLTTAERADLVAVVDEGRLVETGTHAELIAQGGRYAALYSSWSGRFGAR
ncbi:MAG: ABC transporter ATP-binding protein/permease [Acidimicrobiia bacterium]|nr:ABC transporter ATP-binding protein/permease [Acidimicrobiia bacterium]